MRLSELLQERLVAGVYKNMDETLHVISKLVKHKFGLPNMIDDDGRAVGLCLLTSVLYSIDAVSHLKAVDVVRGFNPSDIRSNGMQGISLADIYKLFENPITVKGKRYQVKLSSEQHPNVETVIHDVKAGQPVVMTFVGDWDDGDFVTATNVPIHHQDPSHHRFSQYFKEPGHVKDDIVRSQPRINGDGENYHSMLVIGVDERGRCLICRDSRHLYSYKGYIKVPYDAMKQNHEAFKFLNVVVDSVERLK